MGNQTVQAPLPVRPASEGSYRLLQHEFPDEKHVPGLAQRFKAAITSAFQSPKPLKQAEADGIRPRPTTRPMIGGWSEPYPIIVPRSDDWRAIRDAVLTSPTMRTVVDHSVMHIWRKPPTPVPLEIDETGPESEAIDDGDQKELDALKAFIRDANGQREHLWHVLEMATRDAITIDNGAIAVVKKYTVLNETDRVVAGVPPGGPLDWEPLEIHWVDPATILLVADNRGRPMGPYSERGQFTCIEHRKTSLLGAPNLQQVRGTCRVDNCGKPLIPVAAVAIDQTGQPEFGYIDGEFRKWSPSWDTPFWGIPKAISVWQLLRTEAYMDLDRMRRAEYGRPPKEIVAFNTTDQNGLDDFWEREMTAAKSNPHHLIVAAMPFSSSNGQGGSAGIQKVTLGEEAATMDQLAHQEQILKRIGACYGASPIMLNDTSAGGGLNNEGLQVTVALMIVHRHQQVLHEQVFPWLLKQLKAKTWRLQFPSPVEADKAAEAVRRQTNLSAIEQALRLGFTVELRDEEDGSFLVRGEPTLPAQPPGLGGFGGGSEGLPKPPGPGGGGEKPPEPKEPKQPALLPSSGVGGNGKAHPRPGEVFHPAPGGRSVSPTAHDGGALVSVLKAGEEPFARGLLFSIDIVKRLLGLGVFSSEYAGLGSTDTALVNDALGEIVLHDMDLTVGNVVRRLTEEVPGLDPAQAENIARTEMARFANLGRALDWGADELSGDRWLYGWIGPDDHRTTTACRRIAARMGDGVQFDEAHAIAAEESRRWGREQGIDGWDYRGDFLVHFQCRHVLSRLRRMA